jgi:hypothetical protein
MGSAIFEVRVKIIMFTERKGVAEADFSQHLHSNHKQLLLGRTSIQTPLQSKEWKKEEGKFHLVF